MDIKQPQQVTSSVHSWLLNRNRHQPLLCPPGVCKMYLLALYCHYNKFLILPSRSGGLSPLREEPMQCFSLLLCQALYLPVSFSRQSSSQPCCVAASPCVSPCVSVESYADHCTLSQLVRLCPVIPDSLLLPCSGKLGCELGGWMFLK